MRSSLKIKSIQCEKRKWAWGKKYEEHHHLREGQRKNNHKKEIKNRGSKKVGGNPGEFCITEAKQNGLEKEDAVNQAKCC